MTVDPTDPATWPTSTIVVRCGTRSFLSSRPLRLDPGPVRCDSERAGAESGAEIGSMDAAMITLQADFNHLDAQGRLRLGDLRMHQQTPFAQIAAKNQPILFIDGEDVVRGELVHDP